MNIFIAVISTIFWSLSDIFFKKALQYKINLWNNDFLWQVIPFLFLMVYFFVWLDKNWNWDIKVIFSILLTFIIYTLWVYLRSQIFKVEKITYLLPYSNLEKIFTIIFSFFLFWDISIITFFIILFTVFFIGLLTIDRKNLTFSKHILIFSFSQLLYAIWNIMTGYILLEGVKWGLWVDGFSFITYYLCIGTIALLIPFLLFRWFQELKGIGKGFYLIRGTGWILWWASWYLSIVVISHLGLSVSILLSFIGMFTTLLFSFFILKERPERKDIFLTISVLILISLWFYLK